MKLRRAGIGAALAIALVVTSIAIGAPTSTSPPTIKGYPGYNSKLTCQPGSWSADARKFDYEWIYAFDGSVFALGPTYRVEAARLGDDIACRVTATDADGQPTAATSSSVRPGPGRTTIVLKAKKVQHGKLTLTGKIGPKPAVKGASIPAYRVKKDSLLQLFGKTTLKPNGKFKIVAPDDPGKHKYKVNFNPEQPGLWQFNHAFVKVRLKKH